ncbi:MAG: 3-hydroxyacyl-CoA dehydrogenase/enoyl-CoA hydratase/3-hydroxybutyryl-CoA epimerase [Phenylobacterium sp.]|jgi:3-hydroxyacyl-CoA dehydrogenase/enoyl-CoA hydratase/3-hydroxybutyryl-CoA epimerase
MTDSMDLPEQEAPEQDQDAAPTSIFSLEVHDNGVAVITMDIVGESMNTLRAEFAPEVRDVLGEIKANSAVKGIVFISGKKDNFIAGADISMLDACTSAEEAEALGLTGQQLFDELEALDIPVVAAIHGAALGGGLEFALACHSRICTDHSKTQLGLPEVQLGLLPGSGGTQRLPRLIGLQKALDMILTGKQLRAKQAKKIGLVDEVVPQSILLEAAMKIALDGKHKAKKAQLDFLGQALEKTSVGRKVLFEQAEKKTLEKTRGNYPAAERILEVIQVGADKGFSKGLALEAKRFGELCMSEESKALRSIFFATTDMKKETGAEGIGAGDETVTPQTIKKAGVLGGGLMGGGIAHVTVNKAGIPVRIKDISHEGIVNAMRYGYDILNKKVTKRFMSKAELQSKMNMLTGSVDYTGFKDVDIVVEAVFEDLTVKQQMVADIEENCAEHTIFATNTSSLPIQQIAAKAARPENVIGLHYFSPVEKMPLAEVIVHEGTSAQTIATTVAFAKKQGKTPIVVKDGAGFYVNRILALYMNEAANILLDGEPIEHIDEALMDFGFPVGPITLLDEVGIDVGAKISPILEEELGARFVAPTAFDKLIDDDRKGKKNKKGFYLYKGNSKGKQKKGSKNVDESVYALLGITAMQRLNREEVAERCVVQMLNEAARCLDDGIIASPRDGDIGAIFGIGFAPFRGGPFRYMDSMGIDNLVSKLKSFQERHGERFAPCELLEKMADEGGLFYS